MDFEQIVTEILRLQSSDSLPEKTHFHIQKDYLDLAFADRMVNIQSIYGPPVVIFLYLVDGGYSYKHSMKLERKVDFLMIRDFISGRAN